MAPPERAPGVVVGEAVELDLVPAKLPTRGLALALDLAIVGVVEIVLVIVVVVAGVDIDPALATALVVVLGVLGLVAWPTAWETLTRGRSPGKIAFGLRVVRDDGGPIRFRHALVRALTGLAVDFGLLSGVVAMVVAACSPRGQRVGDLLAGTVVLRERVPRSTRARPLPAPESGARRLGVDPAARGPARRPRPDRAPVPRPHPRARPGGPPVVGRAAGR